MKKRMIFALVLCLACANDADDGASSSESDQDDQSVSVAETGGAETSTDASAESTSSTDETSAESGTAGTDGTDMNTSSVGTGSMGTDTSGVGTGGTSSNDTSSSDTSNASSNANGSTSNDTSNASSNANGSTSTGTELSGTGSDASSKPTEGSENGGGVDTSSSSGNPSQTGHKHSYKTTVVKPTCTEDGYTLHKCSCGDSYKDNEVPAIGHDLLGIQTIKNPTDTERGEWARVCIHGCGYSERQELYSWNEVRKIEEERILYWLNKYRAEEGAPTLTMSKKLTELNELRCEQSLQGGEHRGHNLDDIAKACEAVKVGCFCDYVYHASDGTVVQPHWDPHDSAGQEAWHGSSYWEETAVDDANAKSRIDAKAKFIADAFRASEGHWWYVGGVGESWKNAIYVGIGIGPQNCYVTVCDYNPDEKGYKHITLDEDGNEHIEWVKD